MTKLEDVKHMVSRIDRMIGRVKIELERVNGGFLYSLFLAMLVETVSARIEERHRILDATDPQSARLLPRKPFGRETIH